MTPIEKVEEKIKAMPKSSVKAKILKDIADKKKHNTIYK